MTFRNACTLYCEKCFIFFFLGKDKKPYRKVIQTVIHTSATMISVAITNPYLLIKKKEEFFNKP